MRNRIGLALTLVVATAACSSSEERGAAIPNTNDSTVIVAPPPPADGGSDGTTDATLDGSLDASPDGSLDAGDSRGDVAGGEAAVDTALPDVPIDTAFCQNTSFDPDSGESDENCGGFCPTKCADGKLCNQNGDCVSQRCNKAVVPAVCSVPTCTDGAMNGDETDLDCGGPSCNDCADNKKCKDKDDCISKVCTGGFCKVPTCSDGVQNANESDVDCGGACAVKCALGVKCASAADCTSGACAAGADVQLRCQCKPGMARVTAGGGIFCMDRAEVSYLQYSDFLASASKPPQEGACIWNTNFTPSTDYPPATAGDAKWSLPVTYLDWCDASAYCKWQGKSLCGKIGGGPTPYDKYADIASSKFFNACTINANTYPYSGAYRPLTCNGYDFYTATDAGAPRTYTVHGLNTPTMFVNTTCAGGPQGDIYQLSGNVAEWEDSCEPSSDAGTGETEKCLVRGGGFLSTAQDLRCDAKRELARNTQLPDIGFRCCL